MSRHHHLLQLALLVATLGLAPHGTAAEAAGDAAQPADSTTADRPAGVDAGTAEPEVAEGSGSGDAAARTRNGDPEEDATGDVFVPTEEISEDFAVSFPVDI